MTYFFRVWSWNMMKRNVKEEDDNMKHNIKEWSECEI